MKSRYWCIWNIFIDLIFLRVLSTDFYCSILLTYLFNTLAHMLSYILCNVQTMSLFTLSNVHSPINQTKNDRIMWYMYFAILYQYCTSALDPIKTIKRNFAVILDVAGELTISGITSAALKKKLICIPLVTTNNYSICCAWHHIVRCASVRFFIARIFMFFTP